MSTLLTDTWQRLGKQDYSFTYQGNTLSFTIEVYGYRGNFSGSSAPVYLKGRIINNSSIDWIGTNKSWSLWGADAFNIYYNSGTVADSQTLAAGSFYEFPSGSGVSAFTASGATEYSARFAYSIGGLGDMEIWGDFHIASAPADLTISPPYNITKTGATFDVSVSDWGTPNDASTRYIEAGIAGQSAWQSPYLRSAKVINQMSATIVVDNNSSQTTTLTIEPNTSYYYGGHASSGFIGISSIVGQFVTLPEDPVNLSLLSQTYHTFNTVIASFSYTTGADGGALTKTIYARYISDESGAEYSEWVSVGTVSSGAATTGTFTLTLPTDSEITIQLKEHTSAGDSENSISVTVNTLQTHEPPIFTDFDYQDANPDTVAVTSDSSYLISNLSILRMEVPVSKKATPFDPSYPVVKYAFTYEGATLEQPFSDSQTVGVSFDAASQSGVRPISVKAVDSLGANTTVSKNITILPYSEPTLTMTTTRIDEAGNVQLSVGGNYSPLTISGTPKNSLTVEYKLSDTNGTVIDWTPITITITSGEYAGSVSSIPVDFDQTYLLETRTTDAFSTIVASETLSPYEKANLLDTPQYSIEVWTRDGNFVADISQYLTSDLSISWTLNDIEDVSFSVSLDAMEVLRESDSIVNLLTPYAHDVRIRRNGKYVVGCQVVEANIKIDSEQIPTVQVKATGFLNIFKDQYISEPLAGYTYPEMAHKIINRAQHADCLIKNPTGDIDASYWLTPIGTISQTTIAKAGAGAIQCSPIQTSVWCGLGIQMNVPAGTPIHLDVWISGKAGSVYARERELITTSSGQVDMATFTLTSDDTYTHFTADYTTTYANGYIFIEQQQNTTPIRVDNCFISRADDEDSLNNHYVGSIYVGLDDTTGGTGHNYATTGYVATREFNYELQNAKDAIMDLVNMGEDHFDFEFTPDRIFNTYDRKGSDRTDIEVMYPGNVYSLQVDRSAADMANKIQEIGSGIGDERLEVFASDTTSRQLYGTRESVVTANNVSLEETLTGLAQGELDNRGKMTQNVSAVIKDGSINCGNIQTGDVIPVKIGAYLGVLGQQLDESGVPMSLLGGIEGWYLVKKISANIDKDGIEQISLTLEFEESFDES